MIVRCQMVGTGLQDVIEKFRRLHGHNYIDSLNLFMTEARKLALPNSLRLTGAQLWMRARDQDVLLGWIMTADSGKRYKFVAKAASDL